VNDVLVKKRKEMIHPAYQRISVCTHKRVVISTFHALAYSSGATSHMWRSYPHLVAPVYVSPEKNL
jgi:hypothetical protein